MARLTSLYLLVNFVDLTTPRQSVTRLTSLTSPRHDKVSLRLLDSFGPTEKMNEFLFSVNPNEYKENGVFFVRLA